MTAPAKERPASPPPRDGDDDWSDVSSAATVAKWLVPSVTALFAIVGYIVQSAQQDLLGLHYIDREAGTLFVIAGDFFRDVVMIPVSMLIGLFSGEHLSLGGHGPMLLVVTLLLLAFLLLRRLRFVPLEIRRMARTRRMSLTVAALLLLLAGKFVFFDEPLFQVRNIVLGEVVEPTLGDPLSQTVVDRLVAVGMGWSPAIDRHPRPGAARTQAIRASIVCSRVSLDTAQRESELAVHGLCTRDQDAYEAELRGRFVAQIWAAALIIALSVKLLRTPARSHVPAALAVLALAYSLLVPYAYGKLQRSTFFDFGSILVANTLRASAGDGGTEPLHALILSRGVAGTVLLTAERGRCTREAQQAEKDYSLPTLQFLSPTQVLAINRIYRQDVIAWAALNARNCPRPAFPGA